MFPRPRCPNPAYSSEHGGPGCHARASLYVLGAFLGKQTGYLGCMDPQVAIVAALIFPRHPDTGPDLWPDLPET